MIEIYPNLFVGNEIDYECKVKNQEGWAVVQACKEPYHRQALGYTGRACFKEHPEYLIAVRDNRLILNLVDVDDYKYISRTIMDAAMLFIYENLNKGLKVLVHCNQGKSRSAGIGLLYLAFIGEFTGMSFYEAEEKYKNIYIPYYPSKGIRNYMIINWEIYSN